MRRLLVLVPIVAVADAAPRRTSTPPPPAKLEDPCLDARCERHALDHFREALAKQRAGKADRPLRISYFGDSLTAGDHLPGGLREQLGALVGEGGPGFVWAAEPHPYCQQRSVTLVTTGSWRVRGISTRAVRDRLLGLGGSAEGRGRIRWRPRTPVSTIDVHYLEQPRGGTFEILADGEHVAEVSTAGEHKRAAFREIELPAPAKSAPAKSAPAKPARPAQIELRARGRVRLFGVALEAERGVVVDNLGIVNATAKGMVRYNDADHLKAQLAHRASDLVIVMLGTNEAGWLHPKSNGMAEHERVMSELLATIRAASSASSCLVISPLDQIDWDAGRARPRKSIPAMVAAQRRAALANGCAFWDVYTWMGGKGASRTWFRRHLLAKDAIHLTVAGAKRVTDALFAGLVE